MNEMSMPKLISPADGQPITNPIGGAMVVKLRDADTHQTHSMHDNVLPPGSPGPRPHRHHYHDEVFYVLDGTLAVRVETDTLTASPGGMDQFFVEVARRRLPLQTSPPDPVVVDALAEFTERYGYEFAELPDA